MLALSVLIDTGLLSSSSSEVFSSSSLAVLQFPSPHSSVFEFVCWPWSEVCSARVRSLLLLLLLYYYYTS